MRVAILETISPSGHETEFDRALVSEMKRQGHECVFCVPEKYPFMADYGTEVKYLEGGEVITYSGAGSFKKFFLSLQREYRRVRWFNSTDRYARKGGVDCIVIPTATPRYLRSLLKSSLRASIVPVIVNLQVFSFEKKGRKEQFVRLASKLEPYKNVHILITSANHEFVDLPNVSYINPPFYAPSLIKSKGKYDGHEPVIIGLYGFYRSDENTKALLDIIGEGNFSVPVKLIMQTVTNNDRDRASCDEIVSKFKYNDRFEFTDAYLNGASWQQAIDDVDVILVPYASKQYFYTYSAMCFNALGFRKPVMLASTVNPQILENFKVGIMLDFSDLKKLKSDVQRFINGFKQDYSLYLAEIERASEVYSIENVVKGMFRYCQ